MLQLSGFHFSFNTQKRASAYGATGLLHITVETEQLACGMCLRACDYTLT